MQVLCVVHGTSLGCEQEIALDIVSSRRHRSQCYARLLCVDARCSTCDMRTAAPCVHSSLQCHAHHMTGRVRVRTCMSALYSLGVRGKNARLVWHAHGKKKAAITIWFHIGSTRWSVMIYTCKTIVCIRNRGPLFGHGFLGYAAQDVCR